MRITPNYLELQKQLHAQGNYGTSGHKHADRILGLCQKLQTKDVLDYGCGQQTLQKALPFPIKQYDPCLAGFDSEPACADIVVCSDVLEHVERECLSQVLEHLAALTNKVIFFDIACRPANKVLADGRNAHILQEPPMWWLNQLNPYFDAHSFQTYNGGFVLVSTPWPRGELS